MLPSSIIFWLPQPIIFCFHYFHGDMYCYIHVFQQSIYIQCVYYRNKLLTYLWSHQPIQLSSFCKASISCSLISETTSTYVLSSNRCLLDFRMQGPVGQKLNKAQIFTPGMFLILPFTLKSCSHYHV